MARDFTKNLANYMNLGIGAIGPLINGAERVSVHVWARFDSLETTNATNDRMLSVLINGAFSGLAITSNAPAGTPLLRVQVRSAAADGAQNVQGTTPLITGSWLSLGAMVDFAGDTVTPYVGGVSEGTTGVTFGSTSYTHGTPTESDMLGSNISPPVATANQVDGGMAEIAIWTDNIGNSGFAQLADGTSAEDVFPGNLVFYMKLEGNDSPELCEISSVIGTITGSLPQTNHPYMRMPQDSLGLFDDGLSPLAWFDESLVPTSWFDSDLIEAAIISTAPFGLPSHLLAGD